MNFFDAYEVSGTATPPAAAADEHSQQSLNEEVSQVIGHLGRFWGGFRKQSQTAIEIARKDLGQVVEQAQKELTKFNSPVVAESASTSTEPSTTDNDPAQTERADPSEHGDGNSTPTSSETPSASHSSTNFSPQSLFTRLQSSLPPNIVSTVQSHIPPLDSIRHATSQSVDFTQLRTTLTSEFQRVQGVTRAQAEEYVHKSEGLLREAVKEAGEFIKDAVKVVPPEEQGDSYIGVLWDGSDVWMLPSAPSESSLTDESSGKGKETDRTSGEARRAVATRAESLLRRLRHDPDIIRTDPEADESVKPLYDDWLQDEVVDRGGIQSPEWMEKRNAASNLLGDEEEFIALQTLIPSAMTEDLFWTRYFFRAYQIDREAERRRALIQAPSDSEDAFSWEDEEEEPTSPSARAAPSVERKQSSTKVPSVPSSQLTPGTLSPRDGSEASYDLVSNSGEENLRRKDDVREEEEEEDHEDEDDDEEGEGDSDWE